MNSALRFWLLLALAVRAAVLLLTRACAPVYHYHHGPSKRLHPPNSGLQPYYPSPYADRGWLSGGDCVWAWGDQGRCRYHGDGPGEEGWAEVHWAGSDWTPVGARPCDLTPRNGGKRPPDPDHNPFCPDGLHSGLQQMSGGVKTMGQLWVIIVSGHVAADSVGNQFFHSRDLCIAKAAELGGACEVMAEEPPKNSSKHRDWEKIYCIPGRRYMMNGDGTTSCPAPKSQNDNQQ